MNLAIAGIGSVIRVFKACKLDAGVVSGIYCNILTETGQNLWVILSGARLATAANSSLVEYDSYSRAYANYQKARTLCRDGILTEHFTVFKGSESQCLSILLGTPSSRPHASRYLTTLSETQMQEEVENLRREEIKTRETDDWRPDEKAELEHAIEEDRKDGSGIVYLLRSEDDQYGGLVKIGMTRRTLEKRIRELAEQPAGLFSRCNVLFHIEVPNPQTIEKGLHYLFATYRKPIQFQGVWAEEWFDIDWQQAKRVMLILDELKSAVEPST